MRFCNVDEISQNKYVWFLDTYAFLTKILPQEVSKLENSLQTWFTVQGLGTSRGKFFLLKADLIKMHA